MDSIVRLKEMNSFLTKTELKISHYILGHLEMIKSLKLKEMSEIIGVSQPSIIRLAKKLGYKGFPEFKIAFSESVVTQKLTTSLHKRISLDDEGLSIVSQVSHRNIEAIKNTEAILDRHDITSTVKALENSRRIYLLGAGFSGMIAKNFMYKLLEMDLNVIYADNSHLQVTSMNTATSKDLVFVISQSGETYEVIKAVEVAKKNNAKIISLTKVLENSLSKLSDITIRTVAENPNPNLELTALSSTVTQLTVIDIIYTLLMKSNYEKNYTLAKKNMDTVKIFKQYKNN